MYDLRSELMGNRHVYRGLQYIMTYFNTNSTSKYKQSSATIAGTCRDKVGGWEKWPTPYLPASVVILLVPQILHPGVKLSVRVIVRTEFKNTYFTASVPMRMKTFQAFSSPIVACPTVILFSLTTFDKRTMAESSSPTTDFAKAKLPAVYSCPAYLRK